MSNTIQVEFKPKYPKAKKLIPLILTVLVIAIDQLTKYQITSLVPFQSIGASFFDGFLRIIHVSNPGIAFSIGQGWSAAARGILFRIVPLIVLVIVIVIYFRNDSFTQLQRWCIAGIVGGGFGNLIDRFFRKEGVIDFIDVQWFGIENAPFAFLRWNRWPTFNVADAAVVVCGILLIISFALTMKKNGSTGETE